MRRAANPIFIPIRTISLANTREHWTRRAKRAKEQRRAAYMLTESLGWTEGSQIVLRRVSTRFMDSDNLAGALKSVRDGVADRLGIDDGDPRLIWVYEQRKGRMRQPGVEVFCRTKAEAVALVLGAEVMA